MSSHFLRKAVLRSGRYGSITLRVQRPGLNSCRQIRNFETFSKTKDHLHDSNKPGSFAFADSDIAVMDNLFRDFSHKGNDGTSYLDLKECARLLTSIGERLNDTSLQELFHEADCRKTGEIKLEELLSASDKVLGNAASRIILVVGGPASGKSTLCDKLGNDFSTVIHLCTGTLVAEEVESGTPLGQECESIMAQGEKVPGAAILALVRRRMRAHPGKRVLLTGFPRTFEDARDFVVLMGTPEIALNLECDDTVLMEREFNRDDVPVPGDVDAALKKLRNFHKHHRATMGLLREQHVPIVHLDCAGTQENVWDQLLAIGRLMRPASRKLELSEAKVSLF
eukprot:scaffold99600_cov44-Attheya_sp.AAC.3